MTESTSPTPPQNPTGAEKQRILAQDKDQAWRLWGPYLSERQWGTVREDYSADGKAWEYFSHDHARSRAYRWGEDGIAGFCDDKQRLCLGLALWNERDPILKERLFGLTNGEGNHGEDVKELYYHLDATPSHSYLKMLYKYPQQAFPYATLIEENRKRDRHQPEFELLDTGLFDDNRYFDVFVEYAKAGVDDILMLITAHNRGNQAAPLHILPHLWFRNTWSWGYDDTRPTLAAASGGIAIGHAELGNYQCYFDADPELLFCDNDTNIRRLYNQTGPGFFKDAFHEYLVGGNHGAVNPQRRGTKAAGHFRFTVPAYEQVEVRLRLCKKPNPQPFEHFEALLNARRNEADEYYANLQSALADDEARLIQRQALAGMIWSKQFYYYDVPQWLNGDPAFPPPPAQRRKGRNKGWEHLNNADVISMPDTWEYPWYAAWDLAFHCVTLAMVDPAFAKNQLLLMTREWYMHPNGQIPAYEWRLGDVNPPVHAWAAWEVYQSERNSNGGVGDLDFLERIMHKLIINFTWWVNRKDAEDNNVFQGGFLGLDNIGVFDRSAPLPAGGYIDQADGTSWMAMYCLNLMRIALELALHDRAYEDIATKFFEHFLYIAQSMSNMGSEKTIGLWDETDQFFYDVLRAPNGKVTPLRVRSMIGLIPFYAVQIIEPELLDRLPDFSRRMKWFLDYRPDLASLVSDWNEAGHGDRRLLSLLRGHRMKKLLQRMLDETEFLSDYGVRSLSRAYSRQPFVMSCANMPMSIDYQPGEAESAMFGGNSNWRGPIWFPVNYLLITSLRRFAGFYGERFKIECPTGSGKLLSINEVADELSRRLVRIFRKDGQGRRPAYGRHGKLQNDPHFTDYLLFHEYFHGDNGQGLGASHQTGWTGLVAKLLEARR